MFSEAPAQLFSCEFCEICKNTFLAEHHLMTASDYDSIKSSGWGIGKWNCKLWYRNQGVAIWARSVSNQKHQSMCESRFNPFVPNAAFLYILKKLENLKVFWCLLWVEKGCMGNNWVNSFFRKSLDHTNFIFVRRMLFNFFSRHSFHSIFL